MRQNFLTVPRPVSIFDELVSTVAASRFSFQEESLLEILWKEGEECHLGEDPRFQPTRWGNWCLREQKPANQELVTRLLQSWDGSDLQAMLASLDGTLKSWSIFDLADPRLHWDGERLRMMHLPIYGQEHPSGNCTQGWLPLWRSSQLSPESESPRPQYLRLRSPARPDHFALYLDCVSDLGRPGMLFLCSDGESGSSCFGWRGNRLGPSPDQVLGVLDRELYLKDLFSVLPETEVPVAPPSVRLKSGDRTIRTGGSKVQRKPIAQWVLDRAGVLYARIGPSVNVNELLLETGETVRPGDYLPAALGTNACTLWVGEERWTLAPPAPDRISLFRASGREKSLLLQTRSLSRSSGRRWLVPPSLREQAERLTHLAGLSVLAVENDWAVFESAPGAAIPAELLDSLGLQGPPGKSSIELRGQPPVSIRSEEEGEWPVFLESSPPNLWVEPLENQTLEDPHLVVFHNDTQQSIPLHGEPPWRVQLVDVEAGKFQALLVDEATGLGSDRTNFELVQDLPERVHCQVCWIDDTGDSIPIERITGAEAVPPGLCLFGPPCWPVDVSVRSETGKWTECLSLDQAGRLSWSKVCAQLKLPPGEVKLAFHFRGLANLHLTCSARESEQDWSNLKALQGSKFWALRGLSSLSQRWEHLIAPVLATAGLRAMQLSDNLWELQRAGCAPTHLWIGRIKDWHLATEEAAAAQPTYLLLSDGVHWGRAEDETRTSIEDCLREENWRSLQGLLLESGGER